MSPIFVGRASLVAQLVKNLPVNAGDTGLISRLEDPVEKEMLTLSSIFVWEIPRTEEPGKL